MKLKLAKLLLSVAPVAAPLHAASIVLVDFGVNNTGLAGHNEITSISSMAVPVTLLTANGDSSGLSISFTGDTEASSGWINYNGVNLPMARGTEATAAWNVISGGGSVAAVAAQGLGFDSTNSKTGSFLLSGLIVGEKYSLMLLSGVGSTGNGSSWLQFVGVDSEHIYTGYDGTKSKVGTYTSETSTLRFDSYATSGQARDIGITFTAISENLRIEIGGGPSYQAVQGLAISTIPEPSAILLSGLGLLALVRRRR